MAKRVNRKTLNGRDHQRRKEHRVLCKKLKDTEFRKRALDHLVKEVEGHFKGTVDVVVAPKRCRFFSQLASLLNAELRTLQRKKPHFGDGKILHVQEFAGVRDDLITVRERIRSTNGGVHKNQFIPITVVIYAARSVIEFGGDPVVSLSHGCPVHETHMD